MRHADVLIAGGGQAAVQLAASLRQGRFAGSIMIINDEPGLPCQRPPLSKAYLLGQIDEAALPLRPESFFAAQSIELLASTRVTAIDRAAQRVALSSGESIGYGHLALATGARNREIPGMAGALGLRTLADARVLRDALGTARSVAIIGAGFIGLEFAAVAAARGLAVTVIEAAPRALLRGVSAPMAEALVARHRAWGSRLLFGSAAETVMADLVLVAIGVIPNTELAEAAGLACANGIVVDATLLTADPAISAMGDCASFPTGSGRVRLESVQNAADHARCIAERLLGRPAPYAKVPWFWSDQGALKLQIAGLATGHDQTVIRGDADSDALSVFCFAGDRLLAVESLNRPAEHMAARALLARPHGLTPAQAADPGIDLRSV